MMTQFFELFHSCLLTLAAIFLITVIHAVKHVITAPASWDAVGTIQAQELILPALLHTADLSAKGDINHQNCPLEWLGGYIAWWEGLYDWTTAHCEAPLQNKINKWKKRKHIVLTSSEPSRQLSCPSQRKLADTHPPLAHTYSLTEHVGTTGEERGTLVPSWSFLQVQIL